MTADTALLDFLDEFDDPGFLWIARESETGRGFRLHQVDRIEAKIWRFRGYSVCTKARTALAAAMRNR